MDRITAFTAAVALFSWGIGSFIGKIATNRIGEKAVFWDILGYVPGVIIYCLFAFNAVSLLKSDKTGVFLAIIAGVLGSVGIISFYILLTKKDASSAVPLTALYPILTAILAIIFLKEKLTVLKSTGIVLAGIALYLLSL